MSAATGSYREVFNLTIGVDAPVTKANEMEMLNAGAEMTSHNTKLNSSGNDINTDNRKYLIDELVDNKTFEIEKLLPKQEFAVINNTD